MRVMKRFVDAYMKLWYAQKPTIAAVPGWCIGGGTDMVLCADIIVAAESARFGYPPSRVWGTPTTAMWVYRMGLERTKRYLLTGDEISATKAAELGFDFVLLSPVMHTLSHPATAPLGWQQFLQTVGEYPLPVYALGGLQLADMASAWTHGAHGIAMQRAVWGQR
jgi:hypothetical protein